MSCSQTAKNKIVKASAPGSGGAKLALDMDPEAITLCAHREGTTWEAVGSAVLGGPDFAKQIEWLRVEALARSKGAAPVAIWLPEDQVLRRDWLISEQGEARRRNRAADLLESETELTREEIEIAVSPMAEGAVEATCLAILTQTRREAEHYAERWGFEPGPVSCRSHLDRFPQLPQFRPATARSGQAGADKRALGMIGAVAAGLAAIAVWSLFSGDNAPAPVTVTPDKMVSAAAPAENEASASTASSQRSNLIVPKAAEPAQATGSEASRAVRIGQAQGLAWPAMVTDNTQPVSAHAAGWAVEEHHSSDAPAPEHHLQPGPFALGPAPSPAQHGGLSKLGATPVFSESAQLIARQDLDTIRADMSAAAAAQQAPVAETVAISTPSVAIEADEVGAEEVEVEEAGAEVAREDDAGEEALLAYAPELAPRPSARTVESQASGEVQEQTAPAEETAATVPPEDEEEIATEITITTWTPETGVPIPLARVGSAQQEQTAPESAQSNAKPVFAEQSLEAPETETGLASALIASPSPKARPEGLAPEAEPVIARLRRPEPSGSGPSSRSVRSAATEEGLPLDRTSLIGIINVNSGREALVRLPNGRFRRVGRGDVLDGWRVSLIGRDAMRLSRSGKNHTLLLVGR
ncbi:MAG: hypothetical protein AAGF44_02340 [Pseudomonadota bacterium]